MRERGGSLQRVKQCLMAAMHAGKLSNENRSLQQVVRFGIVALPSCASDIPGHSRECSACSKDHRPEILGAAD